MTRLMRVRSESRGEIRYAVSEGEVVSLLPQAWDFADALRALRNRVSVEIEQVDAQEWELLSPVPGPASVRDSVGFLQHIRNTRRSRGDSAPLTPVWNERPGFYFANPWSLRGATDDVAIPAGSRRFDFELEIAAVIGRRGRDLTVEQAHEAIAGYVLFCDWSARDIQSEERTMQIGLGKAKDAAISLGPWILSAEAAAPFRRADGLDIAVQARINGETVTDTHYTGMDWSFEEIVAYSSLGVYLEVGDVVATGTVPTGCLLETAADPDFRGWLAPDDVVTLSAGPLGEVRARILADTSPQRWRRTEACAPAQFAYTTEDQR